MSRHPLQVNFYSGCAKPVNYYDNVLGKALFGLVIGALDLSNCRLVVGVDCSCGNVALFLYVNKEVGKEGGH